ncbi:putative VAN3-binding protein [Helianthus annuus]|nr:putative VAN3-binding protein [Helianthus annuus]
MDYDDMPTLSEAHPETMDLLSRAWCDFAVKEALQPEFQSQALVLHEYAINSFDDGSMSPNFKQLESIKMDDTTKSLPPWKTNDVKSWIWMQQAMHPEVNYSSCFRKKLQSWHVNPFKSSHLSIKKWLKEIKQKKKENERLQNAEVHAAISVAGVAAALAAIAAENSNHGGSSSPSTTKEAAVATAAALVAAHCAKNAEAMGAKKHQIRTAMSSAMSATSTSDILTLTAAASTCNS